MVQVLVLVHQIAFGILKCLVVINVNLLILHHFVLVGLVLLTVLIVGHFVYLFSDVIGLVWLLATDGFVHYPLLIIVNWLHFDLVLCDLSHL